jgi:hypothetical protein
MAELGVQTCVIQKTSLAAFSQVLLRDLPGSSSPSFAASAAASQFPRRTPTRLPEWFLPLSVVLRRGNHGSGRETRAPCRILQAQPAQASALAGVEGRH